MQHFSAEEKSGQPQGVTLCLVGPPAIGKTSQVRTLGPRLPKTGVLDYEAGLLAIANVKVAIWIPETWEETIAVAAALGGPNPAMPDNAPYSRKHHDSIIAKPEYAALAGCETIVIDSLGEVSRRSFAHAELQPDSYSHGKKDLRQIYGLHARQMIGWLAQIQRGRKRNVIMTCVLERVVDNLGVASWELQIEGTRTGRELPAIIDELIIMNFVDFGDGKPTRAFICKQPNPWNYPSKDRSGRLDLYEKPDLGALIDKLLIDHGGQNAD